MSGSRRRRPGPASPIGLAALLASSLAMTACDTIDAPIDPISGAPLLYPEGQDEVRVQSSALLQTGGCQDVEATLRSVLIKEMIGSLQSAFASALSSHQACADWSFFGGGALPADTSAAPTPKPPAGPAHSETNNQVEGVDEADLVKTDGNYLYIVSNGALRIVRAWPAASASLVAKVPLEGSVKKLFLHGDRVLVYASLDGGPSSQPDSYWAYQNECTYGYECVPTGDGHPTRITIFDVTDRSAPRRVRQLELQSSLLSARRVDNAVHTVVTFRLPRPAYQAYPDRLSICDSSRVEIYNVFRRLLLSNLQVLESAALDTRLPTLQDTIYNASGSVSNQSPLEGCRGFLRSSLADGAQLTSLVSLAIDDEQAARAVTIVSRPGVVYASRDSLYLAEPRTHSYWGWFSNFNSAEATTVHKFDLTAGIGGTRYLASGLVQGRLLNQFALDEHDGHLRIASTLGRLRDGAGGLRNALSVLEQQGRALVPVGLIEDIAPGEDIRSVRFAGDRGYIVTFEKTDPLFVADLANPRQPRLLGELKIPGFSTYLHRLDASHLLTIGYDGSDQGSFSWFTGVILQIFDVSNPTQPALKFKHLIGTRGSSSEATTNHLAFNYYAPRNLLALPMTICEGGNGDGGYGYDLSFSGLLLFDVTAGAGFKSRGQVSFPSGQLSCDNWWTQGSSEVKRSVIIENFVFSISDTLLKVNDLSQLQPDLATINLD